MEQNNTRNMQKVNCSLLGYTIGK